MADSAIPKTFDTPCHCLPGCVTDHTTEADFEFSCSTHIGATTLTNSARTGTTLDTHIVASRSIDEHGIHTEISLWMSDADGNTTDFTLTPQRARELATLLNLAAVATGDVVLGAAR